MCLVVLAWQVLERRPLVLVGNRDELHARASAAMHWWRVPRLLGGRFGVVTNLRGATAPPAPPSRGTLIPRFLGGGLSPSAFLAELAPEAHRYAGFSLLVGDGRELGYLSNGDGARPRLLEPGVHGLSNAPLAADWRKVRVSRERLAARLAVPLGEPEALLELLADRTPAPDGELADGGLGLERERALSAPFVVDATYGTRAATALVLEAGGGGRVVERSHAPDGSATGLRRFRLAAPTA